MHAHEHIRYMGSAQLICSSRSVSEETNSKLFVKNSSYISFKELKNNYREPNFLKTKVSSLAVEYGK